MEKQYIVFESELLKLHRKREILECLEGGGVDNWEGYEWSLEGLEGEEIDAEDLEEMYQLYASL
jgi:hypothetical protein